MKSLPVTLACLAFIFGYIGNAEAETDPKVCRTTMAQLTKANMKLVPECAKSMKFKNGKDKSKKQNCILRCALIKAEVTDENGQVGTDSMDRLFTKYSVPEDMMEKVNRTFAPCMEIGIKEPFKTLEEDPYCLTYDPFVKCFMQNMGNVCD